MSKLLMIDDDPVVTKVYQNLFRLHGFDTEVAADGAQGLALVQRFRPDVVLLDLGMPLMSGVQWLNRIRADERFRDLPVVVLTAGTIGWQVSAARNSDVTYILSKEDADPAKVLDAVRAALASGGRKLELMDAD